MTQRAINWMNDFDEGLERARDDKKPLFLDFFKDGWNGCAKLGAVTYPDNQVAEKLNRDFVNVQVDIEKAGKLASDLMVIWTPNLNFFGSKGKRIYRVEGWLPPSEFAAMLDLVCGHYFLLGKKFDAARPHFKKVFDAYPNSQFAPEALYYRGVSRYLDSHEVDQLKEDWIMLQRFYPRSAWSLRSNIL